MANGAYAYLADDYLDPMPQASNAGGIELCRNFRINIATALTKSGNTVFPYVGDTIKLCIIPGTMGILVTDWFLDVPDLDSGNSTVELKLGDDSTVDKFMVANTVGRAAGKVYMLATGVLGVVPCAYKPDGTVTKRGDNNLILTCSASGDATTGVLKGWMRYVQYGVATLF